MSDADASRPAGPLQETERVVRRPAARAAARSAAAWSAEKSMDFGPSAKRLLAPAAARPRRRDRRRAARASSASALSVVGPKILGHATDLIFAGVFGRQLPAGITKAEAVAALRAHGNDQLADMLARHGRRARARASTSPRSATVLLLVLGALRRVVAARRGCRATCSTASSSAPSAGCAPTSRTSSTGCRCATSTGSRAASCSAGSPTTSTTSPDACSRR